MNKLQKYWPAFLIGSMWLWIFLPMISGQTVCGFRDSAYLYYPMFKWIDDVWSSGQVPLWNPYCNYGMPVVGDGSSSVFYPGKLIFLCRFLSFPSRHGIYLSLHVLIAAAGAYRLARAFKSNQAGATLAAISYAFGGSVLFQVTNIIYLVSAAWLPWAMLGVWSIVIRRSWTSAVGTGVVCALMILGGDPQMVYHVGLIAAASIASRFTRRIIRLRTRTESMQMALRGGLTGSLMLVVMVLTTFGLAAIQILPTHHWAQRSERAGSHDSVAQRLDWSGLFGAPVAGTQKDATYQFSQPPWTMAELFIPNFSGKPFPVHQRWTDALPGAERIWCPSLYVGVLAVLLAIRTFRLWGQDRRAVWFSRIGMFFILASFGWFGPVWLCNEVWAAVGGSLPDGVSGSGNARLGPQVGGVYWLMTNTLPGYSMFRYPAKLLVIASLCVSVLAGIGLTRKPVLEGTQLSLAIVAFMLLSCLVVTLKSSLSVRTVDADPMFGPFDAHGAARSIAIAGVQFAAIVAIGFFAGRVRRFGSAKRTSFAGIALVAVTAIDLVIANRWLLSEADSFVFEKELPIAAQLQTLKNRPDSADRIRLYRNMTWETCARTWRSESSPNRLSEVVWWQRETLFPKHHLEHSVALLGSFGSVWPEAYARLTREMEFDLHPTRRASPELLQAYHLHGQWLVEDQHDSLRLVEAGHPPHIAMLVPPSDALPGPRSLGGLPTHFLRKSFGRTEGVKSIASDRINEHAFEVDVEIDGPCILLVDVLYDPGWIVCVENLDSGVNSYERAVSEDELFMQVSLQPGRYAVVFTYSPLRFWIGMTITCVSVVVLSGFMLRHALGVFFPADSKRVQIWKSIGGSRS